MEEEKEKPYVTHSPYKPLIPFLQRVAKAKIEEKFSKVVELLKKVVLISILHSLYLICHHISNFLKRLHLKMEIGRYERMTLTIMP